MWYANSMFWVLEILCRSCVGRSSEELLFLCNKSIVCIHLYVCCCDISPNCVCLILILLECDPERVQISVLGPSPF